MTTTYRENTEQLVTTLETAMDTLFKAEGLPSILFSYGGETYELRDRETRMYVIGAIQRDYYSEHGEFNQQKISAWEAKGCSGERPAMTPADSALMDRLTDLALYEEITDPNPYKVSHTEYPFMSERQLGLRRDRETSDTAAQSTGVDGKDYRRPTKRKRSSYEHWRVDQGAKIRNEARQAQYERDTNPSEVVTYNLYENGGELTEPFVNCVGIGKRWANEMGAMNETEIVREETEESVELLAAA